MVRADPYIIKPLKNIDQDPVYSGCVKCDSYKNFVDKISSFRYFATTTKLKSGDVVHALHPIWWFT